MRPCKASGEGGLQSWTQPQPQPRAHCPCLAFLRTEVRMQTTNMLTLEASIIAKITLHLEWQEWNYLDDIFLVDGSERAVEICPWFWAWLFSVLLITSTLLDDSIFPWLKHSPSAVRRHKAWHGGQKSSVWLFRVFAHGLIEIWGIILIEIWGIIYFLLQNSLKPLAPKWSSFEVPW